MLRENRMKSAMARGETVLGIGLQESLDRTTIHAVSNAGADFVFIDMEHFPLSDSRVADAIAASYGAGTTPLVRIPAVSRECITHLLDSGAQTLIPPRVSSPSEVDQFLQFALYSPQGSRGMFMGGSAGTNFEFVTDVGATTQYINNQLLLGVNVETAAAVDRMDELLRPGINFATLGHSDLSASYGVPGEFDHPLILQARERLMTLCRERGIYYGVTPSSLEHFDAAVEAGANFIVYSGVVALVRRAVQDAKAALQRSLSARPSATPAHGAP